MNSPPQPGSHLEDWRIDRVLSWGRRGGLYSVEREDGPYLLKEVVLPNLELAERLQRLQECRKAIETWQSLRLTQVLPVAEFLMKEDRFYLLMPELPNQPVSQVIPHRNEPPSTSQLLDWADQICQWVLGLQRHHHPLALFVFEPDHMIVDTQGQLLLFNPGWSELAWRGQDQLNQQPLQSGMARFGQLLTFLAGSQGKPESQAETLTPALIWIVGRCLSDDPCRHYVNFQEVQQALQALPVRSQPKRHSTAESLEDFNLIDLPRSTVSRPMPIWQRVGLVLAALIALVGLSLAFRQSLPGHSRPAPAVAIASQRSLEWFSLDGRKQGTVRLDHSIVCLAANPNGRQVLVGTNGDEGLTLVDLASNSLRSLPGRGVPIQLQLDNQGRGLDALMDDGQVGSWDIAGHEPRWRERMEKHSLPPGAQLISTRFGSPDSISGVLVCLPQQAGLEILPAQSGMNSAWNQPGINSALDLEGQVVAAGSSQKTLYALSDDLQPLSRYTLPGGPGQSQLFSDHYKRQFWSLHSQGVVGLWSYPTIQLIREISLPAPPLCACADHLGSLWVVTQDGKLLQINSNPPGLQLRATLTVPEATFMVYLNTPVPASSKF